MTMNDSDVENDSRELSTSNLKKNMHVISKKELMTIILSLMNEVDRLNAGNEQLLNNLSNVKPNFKVLKLRENDFENEVKVLKNQVLKLTTREIALNLEIQQYNESCDEDIGKLSEVQEWLERKLKEAKDNLYAKIEKNRVLQENMDKANFVLTRISKWHRLFDALHQLNKNCSTSKEGI